MPKKYYVTMIEDPKSQRNREVTGLYRWVEYPGDRTLLTDRWDEHNEDWADDPTLLDLTGLGGPAPFIEIDENAAKELVGTWRKRKGR